MPDDAQRPPIGEIERTILGLQADTTRRAVRQSEVELVRLNTVVGRLLEAFPDSGLDDAIEPTAQALIKAIGCGKAFGVALQAVTVVITRAARLEAEARKEADAKRQRTLFEAEAEREATYAESATHAKTIADQAAARAGDDGEIADSVEAAPADAAGATSTPEPARSMREQVVGEAAGAPLSESELAAREAVCEHLNSEDDETGMRRCLDCGFTWSEAGPEAADPACAECGERGRKLSDLRLCPSCRRRPAVVARHEQARYDQQQRAKAEAGE